MDVSTSAGDVYFLDENRILIYGEQGITLQLSQRNLQVLDRVYKTLDCVKDNDAKDRRFTVAYSPERHDFRFEPIKGDQVRCPAWQFGFEQQRKAA